MIVFPAIDIINGQCVRLTYGDYSTKKVYHSDPVEVAKDFEKAGFTHLHMVDLDGAKSGKVVNLDTLERVVKETSLKIDFGGGIRSKSDVSKLLKAGADKINIGSLAVKNPALVKDWIQLFEPQTIILSADVKEEHIAIHGWQESSTISVYDIIEDFVKEGLRFVTCTDISKDGALKGASVELYTKLINRFPEIHLTASGGVHNIKNIEAIQNSGCYGVIVGKAIYEEKIDMVELVTYSNG